MLTSTATFLSATTSTNVADTDMSLDPSTAVDGVTKISEAIAEYGPVVVICGVFIILFILIFLLFMKINNTMVKQMIKQVNDQSAENAKVMNKLLTHLLDETDDEHDNSNNNKDDKNKQHNRDLVGMFIDYNTAFIRESKNVINNLRCDRVAVYVFHNGNKALYGLPFIKMTCVHENTIKGSRTVRGNTHTGLPLHLYNDMIEALYHDGEYAGNLDDIEIHDNSIREFLSFSDSKSLFIRAIKNENGSLAGFTVVEFNKEMNYADHELYEKIRYTVKDMNTAIRYIVTNDKFFKKFEEENKDNIKSEE